MARALRRPSAVVSAHAGRLPRVRPLPLTPPTRRVFASSFATVGLIRSATSRHCLAADDRGKKMTGRKDEKADSSGSEAEDDDMLVMDEDEEEPPSDAVCRVPAYALGSGCSAANMCCIYSHRARSSKLPKSPARSRPADASRVAAQATRQRVSSAAHEPQQRLPAPSSASVQRQAKRQRMSRRKSARTSSMVLSLRAKVDPKRPALRPAPRAARPRVPRMSRLPSRRTTSSSVRSRVLSGCL